MTMGDERRAGAAWLMIESQLYREDPGAFFLSKMLPLAYELLEQFGIDAVPGGAGECARFFGSQGLLCQSAMPPGAAVLAESYARLDQQWTLAECGLWPVMPDAEEDGFT